MSSKSGPEKSSGVWLDDFIPYMMYWITNHLNLNLRAKLRKVDINIVRWRILAVLEARGTLSISKLTNMTVTEQPTISRAVAQLNQEGLVERQADKEDSRLVLIRLTKRGDKAFREIYPTALTHQQRALAGFSDAEIALFTEFLHRVQENIADSDSS